MTTNAATETVQCPKCDTSGGKASGHLSAFRAVLGGLCFLCEGTGTVTRKQAAAWIVGQSRLPRSTGPVATAPRNTGRVVARKEGVWIGDMEVAIEKIADRPGWPDVFFSIVTVSEYGECRSSFGIAPNGRPYMISACAGHVDRFQNFRTAGEFIVSDAYSYRAAESRFYRAICAAMRKKEDGK